MVGEEDRIVFEWGQYLTEFLYMVPVVGVSQSLDKKLVMSQVGNKKSSIFLVMVRLELFSKDMLQFILE